jgi:hypothetical protein
VGSEFLFGALTIGIKHFYVGLRMGISSPTTTREFLSAPVSTKHFYDMIDLKFSLFFSTQLISNLDTQDNVNKSFNKKHNSQFIITNNEIQIIVIVHS